MPAKPHPVVFINGLWLHKSSWQPWESLFEDAGYRVLAPGWPGEPDTVELARADTDSVADKGIDDVVAHFAAIIGGLDASPVLIGHSFGGMIAEKLLGQDRAAAAIAIDAAQIKGVLPLPLSSLRATLPVFRNPANRHRAVMLTAEQFRYSFGNAVTPEESAMLYDKWVVPAPGKPLFEAAAANFSLHSPASVNTRNPRRGPLLLIMGGQDHTVPEAITKSTLKQYRYSPAATELLEFGDRGHSLTIDAGWGDVAQACLSWLGRKGL
ncbi:alpha/beta fold hydrolase [Trebonia sp.]|uniref:alpha/beta hydrolase n=1 Tax=Trebonia sp. TaxID=2767075 RepID=UPI002637F110|nr:alpha/beta fold hydrolase [Trebonia sp.]